MVRREKKESIVKVRRRKEWKENERSAGGWGKRGGTRESMRVGNSRYSRCHSRGAMCMWCGGVSEMEFGGDANTLSATPPLGHACCVFRKRERCGGHARASGAVMGHGGHGVCVLFVPCVLATEIYASRGEYMRPCPCQEMYSMQMRGDGWMKRVNPVSFHTGSRGKMRSR